MEKFRDVHSFENEEIIPHIRSAIYLLQENDFLVKKYSDDSLAKIDRVAEYLKNLTAIECYWDRLNKKRTDFRELWVEKIKQAKKQSAELLITSLNVCEVFSMGIQIEQQVFITNEVDLEIREPRFYIVWELRDEHIVKMVKDLSESNLLCEKDEKHLKQLLQDLGYFFITKGDDTHVAIIKAHLMKQLNK